MLALGFPIVAALLALAQQSPHALPPAVAPLDDPHTFPLAVWLQESKHAPRHAELGINTYVGLWNGPTQAQLDELERLERLTPPDDQLDTVIVLRREC